MRVKLCVNANLKKQHRTGFVNCVTALTLNSVWTIINAKIAITVGEPAGIGPEISLAGGLAITYFSTPHFDR